MKSMVAMFAVLGMVLAGCARVYAPAVALDGVDRAQYDTDLAQCRGAVAETAPSVPAGFIGGAFLGALASVAIVAWAAPSAAADPAAGAIFAAAAAVGALFGALAGAGTAGEKTTRAVDECLRASGYTVES